MQINIVIKEQQKWVKFWRHLAQLGELGAREARLLADAGRRGLALNWEREASPGGAPWAALAKMTREKRRERGFAPKHPILRQTGDLKSSFTEASHARAITQIGHWNGGTVVVIGARENPSTPGRIPLLNRGGVNPSGYFVPRREFIGFSAQALRQIEGQAEAIILQRVERLGG